VISDAVESELLELLDHPTVSPLGLAIPGLLQLLHPASPDPVSNQTHDPSVQRLDEFARHGGGAAEVCYIGSPSLPDPVLKARLNSVGIQVGTTLTISAISRRDRPVSVHTTRSSTKLPTALAQAVHVRAHSV
jgi:DtxR family Mn-dependent transcriptional regulator